MYMARGKWICRAWRLLQAAVPLISWPWLTVGGCRLYEALFRFSARPPFIKGA